MVTAVRDTAPTAKTIRDVLLRVQGEHRDMPGLKLTEAQAQRSWVSIATRVLSSCRPSSNEGS